MHIQKLNIIKFRDIENFSFNFGNKLTFIAGTNGTSKTSILGLIAQPFVFTKDKEVVYRTISGNAYRTRYSDLHKFSEYENVAEIQYDIQMTDVHNQNGVPVVLPVRGQPRKGAGEKGYRFVVERGRTPGSGNFQLPVVYMGLKRLFPLGEHKEDVKLQNVEMTDEERALYNSWHKEIMLNLNDEDFVLEEAKTSSKVYIGGRCSKYDTKGFSAGQDNLGQVFTAILSYKRLKENLGDAYKGGLLLIDELEATMHPQALCNLINFLYKYARDYSLQIIVTTHSLMVLELALRHEHRFDTEVVYLSKSRGNIRLIDKNNFSEIKEDMTCKVEKIAKDVYAICEDDEATSFLNNLLRPKDKQRVKIISAKLGCKQLVNMALSDASKIAKVLYILDGDESKNTKAKKSKNICILPGDTSPEALVYNFLKAKDEGDSFWNDFKPKKIYFNGFAETPNSREKFKEYFKYLKTIDKNMWRRFFKAWMKENTTDVATFREQFLKKVEAVCKN